MSNTDNVTLGRIPQIKRGLPKDSGALMEKDTTTKAERYSEKAFSRLFKGVRNCAGNFWGKTVKVSAISKFFRTINIGACRVFTGTFTKPSRTNANSTVATPQAEMPHPEDTNVQLTKELKAAYFDKFLKPERMANHILSTFFNDGGDCHKSRAAIKYLKENHEETSFSSENIKYDVNGLTLRKGICIDNDTDTVSYLSFDKRKVSENGYIFDLIDKKSFSNVLEFASEVINDKKNREKWLLGERDKHHAAVSKLDNLSDDMKHKCKAEVDEYLTTVFPGLVLKKEAEEETKIALPHPLSTALTNAAPAFDIANIPRGIVAMNANLLKSKIRMKQ